MIVRMQTTIELPKSLQEEAEQWAAQHGCTITAMVIEGLSLLLRGDRERGDREQSLSAGLPSYGGNGGHLLVDLADGTAVEDVVNSDFVL